MKAVLVFAVMISIAAVADASVIDVFKDDAGRTKWQHVANFSGSVLIVLLTLSLLSLMLSRFKLRERNDELREIKKTLESTVRKRTENLNKANRLLENEVEQHKSTKTYLQSILASMPSMLIGLDEALQVTHWNGTAENITGLKQESVLGQKLWEAYPSITVDPEQVERVLNTKKPEIIKHGQRGQYYFDITIYPLSEPQQGVVLIIENVTQRSLAENMLIQRDKMASMGELAETMAHDINTPLQGILEDISAVASELEYKALALESQNLLLDAIEQGRQASAVVNNLLAFSGAQGAEKQSESLVEIVDHCIGLANDVLSGANQLKFREITVVRQYQEELPQLECYSAELQQVFLSLFRQACIAIREIQQSKQVAPRIIVAITHEIDALWVRITHNGRSLTIEEQQNIFEPFVQHTSPVNPKPLAPSNRLSFSYFIVTEHHDGEMAVTSDEESGTGFHIQFHL